MRGRIFSGLIENYILKHLVGTQPKDVAIIGHEFLGTRRLISDLRANCVERDVEAHVFSPAEVESMVARVGEDPSLKQRRPLRALTNQALREIFKQNIEFAEIAQTSPAVLMEKYRLGNPSVLIVFDEMHSLKPETALTVLRALKHVSDDRSTYPGIVFMIVGAIDISSLFRELRDETSPSSIFVQIRAAELRNDSAQSDAVIADVEKKMGRRIADAVRPSIHLLSGGCLSLTESLAEYSLEKRPVSDLDLACRLMEGIADSSPAELAAIAPLRRIRISDEQKAILEDLAASPPQVANDLPAVRGLRAIGILSDVECCPGQMMTFSAPLIDWYFSSLFFDLRMTSVIISPKNNADAYQTLALFDCPVRRFFHNLYRRLPKDKIPEEFAAALEGASEKRDQELAKLISPLKDSVWSFMETDDFLRAGAVIFDEHLQAEWTRLFAEFNHFRRRVMHSRSVGNAELVAINQLPIALARCISRTKVRLKWPPGAAGGG